MALDGLYLGRLRDEIENKALFSRVDKISQPSKDELVITLRGKNGPLKLLLCVRANSPRIQFTSRSPENPSTPPMLCMLFRKHLVGAMIKAVRQHKSDRILFIDFDATNEIGDRVELTICVEIMGKYSNIILFDKEKKIIDSVKRVDFTTSSVRQILPGLEYKLPPQQTKCNINENSDDEILSCIFNSEESRLSKAILGSVQGVSPIVCREIAFRCCGSDKYIQEISDDEISQLREELSVLRAFALKGKQAYMIIDAGGRPMDFSFMPIEQYSDEVTVKKYESFSSLLDEFFFERDRIERTRQRGRELFNLVSTLIERTARKLNIQREELNACADRESLRIWAELINANAYRLEKGSFYYDVENYYDENKILRIRCDPSLSPVKNAQKYYKEYKKAQIAEQKLTELIEKGKAELEYLKTVEDELLRADTESELSLIRDELMGMGYVKSRHKGGKKPPKALPPIEFRTSDGFRVLVGRNNIQNDRLSMKTANNHDMFLHIQKQPGSHVILCSDNREISDLAIEEAAVIAAYYSSARESSLVPIDYTYVKHLKKPVGASPGYVIYHVYYTITVKPDLEFVERMMVKK